MSDQLYLPQRVIDELAEEKARQMFGAVQASGLTRPIPFLPTNIIGQGVGTQPTKEALLRETKGWSAIAGRAIVRRLQTVNFYVAEDVRVADGTVEEERLDDHPLEMALKANPVFTARQLIGLVGWHLVQAGEAYLQKVRDGIGVVRELWPMPTQLVYPIFDEQEIIRGYYVRTLQGKAIELPAEDVVRIWDPDPLTLYTAMGVLGPQSTEWDGERFRQQHLRNHFQRDAIPRVVLESDKEATAPPPGTPTRQAFEEDWQNRYNDRYGVGSGVPAILPSGVKAHELSAHGGVAESAALGEDWRDQFLMAYGVSATVVGFVQDANRANMEAADYGFAQNTIEPYAGLSADALTQQLARPDFDDALRVRFETIVAPDKEFELKREAHDLTHKIKSINMVRAERDGLEPVSWGEEPVGSVADVPYDPDAAAASAGRESETELRGATRGLVSTVPSRVLPASSRAYFDPRATWERNLSIERKWTARWQRQQLKAFEVQRRDVVEKAKAAFGRGRRSFARVTAKDLFDWAAWQGLFVNLIEPLRHELYETVATDTAAALGGDFIYTDEVKRQIADQGARQINGVNQVTQRRIQRILSKATAEGASIDAIAKDLNRVFRDRKRARTIARTETLKASQAAQQAGFRSAGISKKRWNQSFDERVRDSHRLSGDRAVVPTNSAFTLLDGETCMHPGDESLSARNVINCRCFVTPEIEGLDIDEPEVSEGT